jgi:ankyrin repeat protein
MKNLDDLLHRAKTGSISDEEVDAVAREIQANPQNENGYTLLHIVGRSFATRHRDVVESFLDARWNPMLARLSLQILCNFWGETALYLDRVLSALRGLPWDPEDDVRLIAISIAGEYLRTHTNRNLLVTLFGIFNDATKESTIREAAYFALARACGRDWNELPPASRHLDLQSDIDPLVLSQVKAALERDK